MGQSAMWRGSTPETYTRTYLAATGFSHQTGAVFNSTSWQVTVADPAAAYLSYGPYATDVPPSTSMVATTLLWIDDDSHDDVEVATLDVNDAATQTVLASWTLHRRDFEAAGPGGVQAFDLAFKSLGTPGTPLEYRVFYRCCSEVTHVSTTVRALQDAGPMAAFWNRTAHFSFVSNNTFPTPGDPGAYGVS